MPPVESVIQDRPKKPDARAANGNSCANFSIFFRSERRKVFHANFHLPNTTVPPRFLAKQFMTPALSLLLGVTCAHAKDWPYWRGPQFNDVSYETGLIDSWDAQGGPQSNARSAGERGRSVAGSRGCAG